MAKTAVEKRERKQLKVTWVGESQSFGESGQLVRFNCSDGLQYETFRKPLFPLILIDAELDADTELRITTTDDGKQYPHWIVTQIYKDGEPVVKAGAITFRQGYRGKSPEEISSIETQVRAYIVKDLWIADKYNEDSSQVKKLNVWLNKLGVETPIKTSPKEDTVEASQSTETPKMREQSAQAIPQTTEELLNWIARNNKWKTTTPGRSWAVNKCKIVEDRLDTDPIGCYHEIKELMDWI